MEQQARIPSDVESRKEAEVYHVKKVIKNAFRISKKRGETAARIRVPGGHLKTKHLTVIKEIAERFGNGTVHMTTRQGFEIPGIRLADMAEVKLLMAPMVFEIEKDCGIVLEHPERGYLSAGTRNVVACIGDRVCRFSNSDTTRLAQKVERVIYPNDYHLKIAITGCPNDCIKAHLHDLGIISTVIPEYDNEKCIGCEACVDNCRRRVTNALTIDHYRVDRDEEYCIKCGECILKCPMSAFSRGKNLYRIILGGRTGKRNPRLANTFIVNASERVVLDVCNNVYSFINLYIDKKLPKEHLGYIIDRVGFDDFVREITISLSLNVEAKIVRPNNPGYFYEIRI